MRGRRMKKLFDAINLLAQPCGATIKDLAKRLETTERQAYRTIETLQDDFYFVITKDQALLGNEVRYYLKEKDQVTTFKNMKVADLNLSLPEVIALYFLKGHARLYQGTEIETEINRAFAKLDTFVPDGFEKRLEKVKTLFSPSSQFTKDYTGKEKIIDDLTEAMLQQKTCHIEYHSFGDDKLKNFKIDPLRFFERNGGLYAFMRSTSFGDIRILAVERIQSISVMDSTFDYPKDFDPDALLDNAFGIFYDDPITVKVRFPAEQARYIQERRWAKDQKITKSKNGSITLTMNTSGWYDVKRWILSFGPDAELLEPAEMREELNAAAREMAELYNGGIMGKVKSFNLAEGARVGNYRILEKIGRGYEGEVYKVAEVPTEAIRAIKLFRTDELDSVRHLIHFAWYYEQVRNSGSVPIYFHYGQWFLDDDNGCWYLIFEYIAGTQLANAKPSEELFFKVAKAMARVHVLGYAVGDLSTLTNVILRESDGSPIFVDCDPGSPDKPNTSFNSDCLEELPGIAKKMFGAKLPNRVAAFLNILRKSKPITSITLAQFVNESESSYLAE